MRLGFVHFLVQLENGSVVNLRPVEAHSRKRRTLGWDGWGECYGKLRPPRL
jgi:hypothetical protein